MVPALLALYSFVTFDSTPERTIHAFAHAWNTNDWVRVLKIFDGVEVESKAKRMVEDQRKDPTSPTLSFTIRKVTIHGTKATALVVENLSLGKDGSAKVADEVHFVKKGTNWTIVDGKNAKSFITLLGKGAREPEVKPEQQHTRSKKTIIKVRMNGAYVALILFARNHGEKLTISQAELRTELAPFMKNVKLFEDADGNPLDLQINPNVLGMDFDSLRDHDDCVLLTIGPKDKLVYFDGETPVLFTGGHCNYLSPDQVKKLRWNPK